MRRIVMRMRMMRTAIKLQEYAKFIGSASLTGVHSQPVFGVIVKWVGYSVPHSLLLLG